MAQTNFNVGAIANDGTGEPLRQAFQEQQAMNTELYTTKVDKVTGKELTSNDFTDANVVKLAGIEDGAEVNVQADWNQMDNTADDFIKNKPVGSFSINGNQFLTEKFTYISGVQEFFPTNEISTVLALFVNGQQWDKPTQWTNDATKITVLDALKPDSIVSIIYTDGSVGVLPTYTQAQIDAFLALKANIDDPLIITDTFVVGSQVEMLALTAQQGDVAIRTDLSKTFILSNNVPTILANWNELLSPTADVNSVNGQTGVVVLNADNIAPTATREYASPSEKAFWNAKQPLLTNPITGTGTTNRLSKFTAAGVIGDSGLQEVSTTTKGISIISATPTNTSFGYNVLTSGLLTGSNNIGCGHNVLNALTSGNNNTALGFNSLPLITNGSENTALGHTSLSNLTSGFSNLALGLAAGRLIADAVTALTTCNQSVFLGNATKALANSSTNEIVIGHNATGAGSNTATLGNASITKTILRGAVQIGAAVAPTDAVQLQQLPKRQKEVKYKFSGAVPQNTLFGDNFQEFLYQGYNLKKVTVVFGEQSMNVNKTIPILISLLDTDSVSPSVTTAYTADCNAVIGAIQNKRYIFDINVALTTNKLLTVGTGAFTASTQILNNCMITLVLEEL